MSDQEGLSITEKRILAANNPYWHSSDQVRICLSQLMGAHPTSGEAKAKRDDLLANDVLWDGEDYGRHARDERPEGSDPKADVAICGIGGCTLRIFQKSDGSEIKTGNCKAEDYCLKDNFEAVTDNTTVIEGKKLYREILDTCEPTLGGSRCPNLSCGLGAGVSEDGIPGTAGDCIKLQ